MFEAEPVIKQAKKATRLLGRVGTNAAYAGERLMMKPLINQVQHAGRAVGQLITNTIGTQKAVDIARESRDLMFREKGRPTPQDAQTEEVRGDATVHAEEPIEEAPES